MRIAEANFDLKAWCDRKGFEPQGRQREEWVDDCPLCGAEGKFSVNVRTRKFRCFVCKPRLSFVALVALWEGSNEAAIRTILSGSAVRHNLAHIPRDEAARSLDDRPPSWEPSPISPPPSFVQLDRHVPYTERRGFDLSTLIQMGAGICTSGRFQDRLVFPVRRYPDGAWIFFQARATWEKDQQLPSEDGKIRYRKNLNPIVDDHAHYAMPGDVLMGLDWIQALGLDWAMMVEGPTDWLGVGPGAVATLGANLSDRQLSLLVRAGVRKIYLAWDPDAWVSQSPTKPSPALAAAYRLSSLFELAVIHYSPGVDPGSLSPQQNAQARESARPWADQGRLAFIP